MTEIRSYVLALALSLGLASSPPVLAQPAAAGSSATGRSSVVSLGAAPSFALDLNNQALGETLLVDVYRLAGTPLLAEPEQLTDDDPAPKAGRVHPVWKGAGIGLGVGCLFGAVANERYGEPDERKTMCSAFGLLGTGIGAFIGMVVSGGQEDPQTATVAPQPAGP